MVGYENLENQLMLVEEHMTTT